MPLCHRGCGLEAAFINYIGEPCCSLRAPSCPIVKKKIGERSGASRKGQPLSDAHRAQLRAARIGRECNEKTRAKIKQSNIDHWAENERIPWNKGKTGVQVPWNKGKGGYTGTPRRKISEAEYEDYSRYKRAVYSASRKTYKLNEVALNPDGKLLGRCGTKDAYQIDHLIPISTGYLHKIPVTSMSIVENLQILPWKDNLKKSNKHAVDETLLLFLLEHSK